MAEALTQSEIRALQLTAELANLLSQIVGDGRTRNDDLGEFVFHVHAIQRHVMSQAAARAYPDQFRLLGGVVAAPDEDLMLAPPLEYDPAITSSFEKGNRCGGLCWAVVAVLVLMTMIALFAVLAQHTLS